MKNIITNIGTSLVIAVLLLGLILGGVNKVFDKDTDGVYAEKPAALTALYNNTPITPAEGFPETEDDGSSDNAGYVVDNNTLPSDYNFKSLLGGISIPTPPADIVTTPGSPIVDNPADDVPSVPVVSDPVTDVGNESSGGSSSDAPSMPTADGSSLINTILSKDYGSGIQIFQSEKGDIPTDTTALNNAINSGGNVCSFIAVRLSDGAMISYNVNWLYRCASSYKALASLYVYKQAAAGAYNLDTGLTYTSSDYYSGSGIIKSSAFGSVYTLKQVADYSIRYSDNVAFVMLQRYINRGDLVDFATALGCPNAEGFEYTWPNVSALDAAVWWAEIYNFANTSSYGQQLYNVFLNATNPSIKKALDNKYAVAHKSGSMSYYFHDCGIVHSDDPYLLVVYTYNPYNASSSNQTYFSSVVKQIDKLINP